MKHYRYVFAALALLLILVGGLTAAQSDVLSKSIQGNMLCSADADMKQLWVGWKTPKNAPDRYRVSWTTGEKWRPLKKRNTRKAGNAIVTGHTDYIIQGLRLPYDDTLRVRVRAIYEGEPNGPWNCCLKFSKSYFFFAVWRDENGDLLGKRRRCIYRYEG